MAIVIGTANPTAKPASITGVGTCCSRCTRELMPGMRASMAWAADGSRQRCLGTPSGSAAGPSAESPRGAARCVSGLADPVRETTSSRRTARQGTPMTRVRKQPDPPLKRTLPADDPDRRHRPGRRGRLHQAHNGGHRRPLGGSNSTWPRGARSSGRLHRRRDPGRRPALRAGLRRRPGDADAGGAPAAGPPRPPH